MIISRAEWGARYTAGFGPAPLPAREVWLHHSVTIAPDLVPPFDDDYAAVRLLEQIGQDRFGGGISYTFIVTPAGLVFEGHGVARQGAHTAGRNSIARAICLIGNYEVQRPTAAQLDAVAWLLAYGANPARRWWTAPRLNGGHRDAPGQSTACPGSNAEAAIPAINGQAGATPVPRLEPDFMATMSDAEKALLLEAAQSVLFGKEHVRPAGPLAMSVYNVGQEIEGLQDAVRAALGGGQSGPPVLTDADVDRIAVRTIELLGAKTSS